MGKITHVSKSRKVYFCTKCRKSIPLGSSYYRGELYFSHPIIRCETCKLQNWEVTSSDYQLAVGAIVYEWENNYDPDAVGVDNIVADLREISDNCEERLYNMPEGLQDADTGMLLQDRIDQIGYAIDDLECIDEESVAQEVIDEYNSELSENDHEIELSDWDNPELKETLDTAAREKYAEAITEALAQIEV